jgi:hypothetical protein
VGGFSGVGLELSVATVVIGSSFSGTGVGVAALWEDDVGAMLFETVVDCTCGEAVVGVGFDVVG